MKQPPGEHDPLVTAARLHAERQRRWLRDADVSVVGRLAQVGVLGWMVIVPGLLGVLAGRWLDRLRGSGVFWTAPLLLLGLALGCWSGWKWMKRA